MLFVRTYYAGNVTGCSLFLRGYNGKYVENIHNVLENMPCIQIKSWRCYCSSGSIEIVPIDVSNLRRFSSRRNRIGSNRSNVTKSAVQWEFEYTFFALTLNPMGKRRCLEISDYAMAGVCGQAKWFNRTKRLLHSPSIVSVSGRIHCGPMSLPRNQCEALTEGSRTFNGVYTVFTYSNSIMETK